MNQGLNKIENLSSKKNNRIMYTKESAKEMRLNNCEYAEKFQVFYDFVTNHYEFRVNSLTQETEFRLLYSKDDFQRLDQMSLNTILLNCKRAGSKLTDSDMKKYMQSDKVPVYNPIRMYVSNLPEWDGKDTVTPFIQRLTQKPELMNGIHRWLLGMTAQMMGLNMTCTNSLMPLLISSEQGKRKSTFCRNLVPPELQSYYTERLDVSEAGHFQELMARSLIINIDEFDRMLTDRKMASLKNILQLKNLKYRKLHTNLFIETERIASFIGTSNEKQILIDPTGSRRFIVIEIENELDCSPIDHKQLFSQLRHEILNGERTYLTRDEEVAIERLNKQYERVSVEYEIFSKCYRVPEEGEDYIELSSSEIVNTMKRRYPHVTQGLKPKALASQLNAMGIKPEHTRTGNKFRLVQVVG